jgi:asparagine synthase (glutamine-hydrolysing)
MSASPSSRAITAPGVAIPPSHRHNRWEALIGIPFGREAAASPLPASTGLTPREALEAAVLPHLRREPCLVTFSGGRDSSSVLAIAVAVARRHGLPDPIPVTNRFPAAPASDESDWQALVIEHLRITDWVRLEWTDELDMVGPYARRVLRRFGPVFPSNAHFLEPFLERASGGSVLTGLGGDEVMGPHARQLAAAIRFERRVPRRRELRRAARELAPLPVRARIDASRSQLGSFRWIRPQARDRLARDYSRALASTPLAWDRSLDWLWRSRYTQCLRSSMRALGAAHDVNVGLPFLDPATLRSFADASGPRPAPPRDEMLAEVVGDLLPESLLRRRTKASFDHPYWNRYRRDFAESWTGSGLDQELVDPAELRRQWRSPRPIAASSTLLQLAWVADSDLGDVGDEDTP